MKNTSNKETHQKAKSLVPNINLSTLYLYETIQTNPTKFNNSYSKKKNKLKINSNGNEILNKEKKIIDDHVNKDLLSERQRKSKSKKIIKIILKKIVIIKIKIIGINIIQVIQILILIITKTK